MSSIDNRIVQMQFDNKEFEKNIAQSIKSIEEFERSLNFDGAAKGFQNIDQAARGLDLSPIVNAIENTKTGFNALETIAFTVFQRITNAAIDAGKKMYDSIFGGGIKSGYEEYNTQINAIQTILANTSHAGTTLEEVNDALDELNLYADLTIYNFTEMTRNIGTFTAAGVDLETSTAAIKGIANLAAVSGSTSEQASRAMYQLSQALAAGRVGLQDWNSVVNAGMGGKVFQDALVETARVMGINVDLSQGFRESLNAKGGQMWLTTDVLLKTLEKFTGDMTEADLAAQGYTESQIESILAMGKMANEAATVVKTVKQLFDTAQESVQSTWTQSWEYIIGDFDEAKELLTGVSQAFESIIQPSGEARNRVLKFWHDSPYGRAAAIEAVKNVWKALNDVVDPVKLAFKEMFPNNLNVKLVTLTAKFRNFTKTLIPTEETTEKIYEVSKKVFSVVKKGLEYVGDFTTVLKSLSKNLSDAELSSLGLPTNFETLYNIFNAIKKSILNAIDSVKTFGSSVVNLPGVKRLTEEVKTLANSFISLVKDSFSYWGGKLEGLDLFGSTESDFEGVLGVIDRLANAIANFLSSLPSRMDKISEFFSSLKLTKTDADGTESFFERIKNKVTDIFEEYNPKNLTAKAKQFFSNLLDGFVQGAENVDWNKVKNVGMFASLIAVLIEIAKNLHSSNSIFESLAKIPNSISDFIGDMSDAVGEIGALATSLKKAVVLSVTVHKITELAFSLAALALSIAFLSTIPKEDLYRSVIVFGLIALILAAISKLNLPIRQAASTSNTTNIKLLGGVGELALVIFALTTNIAIIMSAMKKLAILNNLNSDAVTKSVWNIVGILAAIVIFTGAIQTIALVASNMNYRNVNMGAVMRDIMGLILITSISLVIIAHAMKDIGSMKKYEWERAHKTIFDFLAVMVVIIGGVTALGAFGNGYGINSAGNALLKMSAGMILVALAIGALMIPMVILGEIAVYDTNIIEYGFAIVSKMLITMAGVIALLIFVAKGVPTNMIEIGTAFVLIAAALNLMMIPIAILGGLSKVGIDVVGITWALTGSILAIGVLLGVMSVVSKKWIQDTSLIEKMAKSIIMVAGAMLMISAALAIMSFSNVNLVQVVLLGALIAALMTALTGFTIWISSKGGANSATILQSFGVALIGLGVAFLGFGAGLYLVSAALPALTDGLPAFSQALGVLLGTLEDHWGIVLMFTIAITALSAALIFLLVKFAPQLGPVMTSIGTALSTLWTNFSGLPTKTKAIIIGTILGVIAALGSMTPEMLEAIKVVIGRVFTYLSMLAGTLVKGIVALIVVILFELSDAIIDNAEPLSAAIHDVIASLFFLLMELVRPLVDKPMAYLIAMWRSGIDFIGGIIGGIWDQIQTFVSNVAAVFERLLEGDIIGANDAAKAAKDVIGGIKNIWNSISDSAKEFPKNYDKYYAEASESISENWKITEDTFKELGDKAEASSKAYQEAQTTLSGIENALLDDSEEYKETASQAADNIAEGNEALSDGLSFEKILSGDIDLSTYMGEVKETLGFELGDMQRMISGEEGNFTESYEDIFNPLGIVMDEEVSDTTTRMSDGLLDMTDMINLKQDNFKFSGKNLAAGFGQGWDEEFASVQNRINSGLSNLDPAAREILGINSPSKVFAAIGKFTVLGLAVGAEEEMPTALEAFTDILSQISDVVDTDIDTTPRIAPVLDTTNLQNGISSIPGMFNTQSYRLGGINARLMDENRAYKEQLAKDSMYNDGNVIDSIRQLHDTTADLASKMENMQIVMDNGALVGAIAPGMDRALGTRAVRKGRGN